MKIYYRYEPGAYQYGNIYGTIVPYYLLKEGWIRAFDYKDDYNDPYYIVDSYGTPGTRADYCINREDINEDEMFDYLDDVKKFALNKLNNIYKDECLKLYNAKFDQEKYIKDFKNED